MITRELLLLRGASKLLNQTVSKRCLTKSSQYPRPPSKHYRLWAVPGDQIRMKDILARQFTMKWHPGLNTGIDDERTIYALCDGVMIITEDKFDPDWSHPLVNKIYSMDGERRRPPLYARYIHVIPKKRVSEFKLVDLV